MGPLGSAAVIKVITNMLAFIHLVAEGEALMLAKKGGLDLAQAFHAIRASSGNSFVHETESQLILNGSYDIDFTMDLACKDLGFAMGMSREFGVPARTGAADGGDLPAGPRGLWRCGAIDPDREAAGGCARNRFARARVSRQTDRSLTD